MTHHLHFPRPLLATLEATILAGTGYIPQPVTRPAWYRSKGCFCLFDFTLEWTVVALYAVVRVDKR